MGECKAWVLWKFLGRAVWIGVTGSSGPVGTLDTGYCDRDIMLLDCTTRVGRQQLGCLGPSVVWSHLGMDAPMAFVLLFEFLSVLCLHS